MEVTAYITILIPVGLAYDPGAAPSPDVAKEHALDNLMNHPALSNLEYMRGYVTHIKLEPVD